MEDPVAADLPGHFGPFSTDVEFSLRSLRCFSCPGPIWATPFGPHMYHGGVGTLTLQNLHKSPIGPARTGHIYQAVLDVLGHNSATMGLICKILAEHQC